MSKDVLTEAYSHVIEFVRQHHPKEIEVAYDFFWEEEDPTDILGGHSLELGFINFEDWLICDYLPADGSPGFIDRYIEAEAPSDEFKEVLDKLKKSFISLYEVTRPGNPIGLKDIAVGGDAFESDDEQMSELEQGYTFAARFIELNDSQEICGCVYPFGIKMKEEILKLIDAQYARYKKNKNPEGTMKDFLVSESYAFNMTWMSCLDRPMK